MGSLQKNPIDIEYINFQQSALLERLIIDFGKMLYESLVKADYYDEVAALSELIGEFTLLAYVYNEKTGRLRGDVGVSLSEAAILKLSAIKKDPDMSNSEWKLYANQTKKALDELEKNKLTYDAT